MIVWDVLLTVQMPVNMRCLVMVYVILTAMCQVAIMIWEIVTVAQGVLGVFWKTHSATMRVI